MYILGISAYYHDSAAALIRDGEIIAAAQEERFSRKKHDPRFPARAIRYCLEEAGIGLGGLDEIVFYDKPLLKFERLLETYLAFAPRGLMSFNTAIPVWLKEKLFLKKVLKNEFSALSEGEGVKLKPFLFAEHHQSHAASAFYPSPFERAGVLCLDGVGEWATTTVWHGEGNELKQQWSINFPHSLGLLYSAFTYYAGFKVNSGEYKLMGLAPYGQKKYVDLIYDNLIDVKEDGTFRLNMEFFNYATGLTMTSEKFHGLFGAPPLKQGQAPTQHMMDVARSIQEVVNEVVLRLSRTVHKELGVEYLCLSGGVALNCVANGNLLRNGPFKDIWIQPAAGDAGGALGSALAAWHQHHKKPRKARKPDSMRGALLGPVFGGPEVERQLRGAGAVYSKMNDEEILSATARLLAEGNVIGWFQGRMEFGPRALGSRSILGDPRNPKMQSVMNLKIKYRESFRPFAPAVLEEDVSSYFDLGQPSPYMLIIAQVQDRICVLMSEDQEKLFGLDKLNIARSSIPAVTHVDYSARIQTIHKDVNPRFYSLVSRFKEITGCPLVVNTSFNVRGEPIVCTPEDAYRCFMRTEMDYLVVENFLLAKNSQPERKKDESWKEEYELD